MKTKELQCRFITKSPSFSYPDFGDWLLQPFVVNLPEGDGIKLPLVEVRHCSVPCLLTQRLGRLQSVFEIIPTSQKKEKAKYHEFLNITTWFSQKKTKKTAYDTCLFV